MTTTNRRPPVIPYNEVRLSFERGIVQSVEASEAPIGSLTACENWVPSPTGGLRVRGSYTIGSTTGLPGSRACKGIGLFMRYTAPKVVQASALYQATWTGSSITPVLTWPQPTAIGNTLLLVVGFTASSSGLTGITSTLATGWVARNDVSGTTQQQAALYDYANAPSQSGDQSPITLGAGQGSGGTKAVTIQMLEVTNVTSAPFDRKNTAAASAASVTCGLGGATAQASEFIIAMDVSRETGTTAQTFSTSSSGFAEILDTGQVAATEYAHTGVYVGTRTAVETSSVTITTSSGSVTHASLIASYKGWYSAASPPEKIERFIAALDNGSTYDIYAIDRNDLASGTWSAIDSGLGSSTNGDPVAFTLGLGGVYYTSASFQNIRKWDGITASWLSASPAGARCIAIHQVRLWAGGTAAAPTTLYCSAVGDPLTWARPDGFDFNAGGDDGETIEDITPYADVLVLGKKNSLWYVSGTGNDSFQLIRLPAGGAAPGRSLIATPWGVLIAGSESAWLWSGSGVDLVTQPIETSYGLTDAFLTCSYIDGSVYICDQGSGVVFVFDIAGPTWRTETTDTASEAPAVIYNHGPDQVFGPLAGATVSALNFRTFPAPTRAKDFGSSLTQTFTATTPELWLAGPGKRFTPKRMWLKLRQRAGDTTMTPLSIIGTYDGVQQTETHIAAKVVDSGDVVFHDKVELGFKEGCYWAKFTLTQTLSATDTDCFDIEDAILEFTIDGSAG